MKTRYFEVSADFKIDGTIVQSGTKKTIQVTKGTMISISWSGSLVTLKVDKQGYLVLQKDLDPKMRHLKEIRSTRRV